MNGMDQQLETLGPLWMEGQTASRIASLLGYGLDGVGLRVAATKAGAVAPASSAVTIAGLTDETCRWPAEDLESTEMHYCGAPTVAATPYCARHSKLAYLPARLMRRPSDRNALIPHQRG